MPYITTSYLHEKSQRATTIVDELFEGATEASDDYLRMRLEELATLGESIAREARQQLRYVG